MLCQVYAYKEKLVAIHSGTLKALIVDRCTGTSTSRGTVCKMRLRDVSGEQKILGMKIIAHSTTGLFVVRTPSTSTAPTNPRPRFHLILSLCASHISWIYRHILTLRSRFTSTKI